VLEHAPIDDFDIAANSKNVRRDTTKHDVGIRAGGEQRNGAIQDSLGCQQRAVGPTNDAGSILDNFDRIERDSTVISDVAPARVTSALPRNRKKPAWP